MNITTYFEKLTNEMHVLYVFKIHVKFQANRIFFIYNFRLKKSKFKHLVDDIYIYSY